MPYKWSQTQHTNSYECLRLWPHSSLPSGGFVWFIAATFVLIQLPLFAVLGTVVLWVLLPFLMITVAAIWLALKRSYHDQNVLETLSLKADEVHLQRRNPKGDHQEWDCNVYWAKLSIYPNGGPVPNYLTLTGNGREVEIGAFLSEDERPVLYLELLDFLARSNHPPS